MPLYIVIFRDNRVINNVGYEIILEPGINIENGGDENIDKGIYRVSFNPGNGNQLYDFTTSSETAQGAELTVTYDGQADQVVFTGAGPQQTYVAIRYKPLSS